MTEVYDYVIVGGGMTGCGIVAELLDFRPDASILIIDKQERLGGHWNFAYPYVRLHNFTSYYTLYGYPMPDKIRSQEHHRAGLPDILAYFGQIQAAFEQQKNLTMKFGLTTSEVTELPGVDKTDMSAVRWSIKYADKAGVASEVRAKTLVMCTHCRAGGAPPHKPIVGADDKKVAPAKNIYPNQIEQMGDLKKLAASKARIAVVGGGKTGADAVMHLYWSGVPMENIVWVKKFDLGFGIRASPQEAFDPPEKRGQIALVPFCFRFAKGVPSSLRVHGERVLSSCLPESHPNYSDKVYHTGGGMLDNEELELLRTVEQVLGGAVVQNADGRLHLEDGTTVEYDWAIWCHGYDMTPYVSVPRDKLVIGMLAPGYMAPINWFASASQGGRVLCRLMLMYEEGLLSLWMKLVFTCLYIFLGVFTGPQNSCLLYAKAGLLESCSAWAISRPKVVRRFGARPPSNRIAIASWLPRRRPATAPRQPDMRRLTSLRLRARRVIRLGVHVRDGRHAVVHSGPDEGRPRAVLQNDPHRPEHCPPPSPRRRHARDGHVVLRAPQAAYYSGMPMVCRGKPIADGTLG